MEQPQDISETPTSRIRLFEPDLTHVPGPISDVLESYSGIPREAQISHILSVRDSAYKVHPYPCLGRFRFLELDLSTHPLYLSSVVPTLTSPPPSSTSPEPLFLDFGTCLGQDIRKLIYDGADPKRLYGSDLNPGFIEDGYALFRDSETLLRDHFIAPADAFDSSPSNPLTKLHNHVTILHITAVFHLFGLDQQIPLAHTCLRLLAKTPGQRYLILGAQTANVDAGNYPRRDGSFRWRHNEQSWREMWEGVVAEEQWRGRVKSLEVHSELHDRVALLRERYNAEERQKQIGAFEEGFRWHVFWIWIEFH